MKKIIYSLSVLFFLVSCSGGEDPKPDALANAIGDKELAEYLSGQWDYTSTGKGMVYWSESLTFNAKSKTVIRSVMSNTYETISNPKFTTVDYQIEGKNSIITLKVGPVGTNYRIEKVSDIKMTLYERIGSVELTGKLYNKKVKSTPSPR